MQNYQTIPITHRGRRYLVTHDGERAVEIEILVRHASAIYRGGRAWRHISLESSIAKTVASKAIRNDDAS